MNLPLFIFTYIKELKMLSNTIILKYKEDAIFTALHLVFISWE